LGSWLILLVEENEPPSPVACTAEPTSGRVLALNTSTAITPTMSKTVKIRVNRAECFFLHLKPALTFFEQSR
jgi:hypothetical protein